jgi:hypothetical protein
MKNISKSNVIYIVIEKKSEVKKKNVIPRLRRMLPTKNLPPKIPNGSKRRKSTAQTAQHT